MEEHVELFKNVTLRTLRLKYERQQTFHLTPNWVKKRFYSGKFRRIESQNCPTVIKLADGGVVAYRVPANLVSETLAHIKPLEQWAKTFAHQFPTKGDKQRRLQCMRRYARWVKYNKGFTVNLSSDYYMDGQATQAFFQQSDLLWKCAQQWFPKHYHQKIFRDMTRNPSDGEEQPLCGLWMGCAINLAVDGAPVDVKDIVSL